MKNKQIITIILGVTLLLIITISLSFAYFTATIHNPETSETILGTSGKMDIYYEGGNKITSDIMYPREEPFITKNFTLTADSTPHFDMNYQIHMVVEENTFTTGAITYTLESTNQSNNGNTPETLTHTGINTGPSKTFLGNGNFEGITTAVHSYTLKLYFLSTDYNQIEDMNKAISAYIVVEDEHFFKVNEPLLATGMTPIKWDESFNEVQTTKDDPDWYDYNSKKWANAKTADGSYWVWIPRYAYKIDTCYNMSHAQCNAATGKRAGDIGIKFLIGNTNTSFDGTNIESSGYVPGVKDTSMHYFQHPSFTFGDDELTGFWASKFESSNNGGVVASKPNVTSWRNINVKTMHNHAQAMKTSTSYGWNTNEVDSHMMKSTEWGAVTYLSKSIYGAHDSEIWNNSHTGYFTGCAGTTVDSYSESTCVNPYNTENGVKASTTHNIYGVYDMSGGAWEYMMTVADNLHAYSGFTAQELSNIDDKYIDKYTGVEVYDMTMYGDAVFETSNGGNGQNSWFYDYSYLPTAIYPWVSRGSHQANGAYAGPFYFDGTTGNANSISGFRPVLVCGLVV